MPASRPRASFEPISPHFDLRDLVEGNDNFQYVDRISLDSIEEQGWEMFEKLVTLHVINGGKPLVIDGFEGRLDSWTFTSKWLKDNHGAKEEIARNLTTQENLPLTIGHYMANMGALTEQFFERPDNYKEKNRQRVYLKDIDCPPVWQEKLRDYIPKSLFYWNDSTGEDNGPGAVDEPMPGGVSRRRGRGIAPAGDLMSSLPTDMRAQNLMCYIGHEGTYTPAHREMCASLGQNIMVHASETFDEEGKPERPGSSIWFMTESKDRHTVAEYWLSVLGHDIEVEDHFAQVVAWQRAPFKVYMLEQRVGDFLLIPPLAPHQVWNRGTRTMKVAWNRTTVETLELAFKEALPNARMVCRDEQYKNKSIVYYTLLKYSALLKQARMLSARSERERAQIAGSKKIRQVQKDFRRLFEMFKDMMLAESFAVGTKEQCEFLPYDSNVTCAYCRGNIFNRFLTCKTCMDMLNTGTDEPYDICIDCFVMGRSCACQSKYKWVEQWKWKDLTTRYEDWRRQIMELDGGQTGQHLTLEEERQLRPVKQLAHICQEQLALRPWVNVKEPAKVPGADDSGSDEEIIVDDNGRVKKAKKKKSKAWLKNNITCHSCCKRHPRWMTAECTMCERGWCYGVLWRAYDLHPTQVMQDLAWECPHCLKICATGACRKDRRQDSYEPKGTLLGHDTRKVADVRSTECLVDFSKANINWLGESVDGSVKKADRLQMRQAEAERAKMDDPSVLDDRYADDHADEHLPPQIEYDQIDPALAGAWEPQSVTFGDSTMQENHVDDFAVNGAGGHNGTQTMYPEDGLTNGFVAPSAVMYQGPPPEPVEDTTLDMASQAVFSKKRARPGDLEQIKLISSKRRKTVDEDRPQPKNKANKQFQIAQENKRLEQARKDGRYIQVLASIKGRKRVVTLKVNSDGVAEIISQPPAGSRKAPTTDAPPTQKVLITSDIAPPDARSTSEPNTNGNSKANKRFRVRLEDDTDFRARTRDGKKPAQPRYEEIEVESDFDEDDGQEEITVPSRKERKSTWQAKKHADDDEDLPDELPKNFKDGSVGRYRSHERRKTMPAGGPGQRGMKAPKIRPPGRHSTGDVGERKKAGRPSKAAIAAALAQAAIGMQGAGENRPVQNPEDPSDDDAEEEEEEEEFHGAETVVRKSILSGPGGRKIKIVGKKDKNRERESIHIESGQGNSSSDGGSEDGGVIPSGLPVRKVGAGPPGRRALPDH